MDYGKSLTDAIRAGRATDRMIARRARKAKWLRVWHWFVDQMHG